MEFLHSLRGLLTAGLSFPLFLDGAVATCRIVDKSENPLKGVEMRLTALEGGEPQYKKSDKRGMVEFHDIKPGRHLFQAQASGYMPLRLTLNVEEHTQLTRVLLKTGDFEKLEQQAAGALEQGKPEAAIESLLSLLNSYPEDAVLHDKLARAYGAALNMDKAVAEADEAARLDVQFASTKAEVKAAILRESGRQALRQRDFKKAISEFEALKTDAPNDMAAYHGLALAYGHSGRYKEALQAIRRAIELDPNNAALKDVEAVLLNNAGAKPR
jgi:tetratricopeptide (TPR) repeat protein